MKHIILTLTILLSSAIAFADGKAAPAAEQAVVSLTGTIGCGHCSFKVTDKCSDAISVKESGKTVVYLIAEDPARKHDESTCESTRAGTVTGVLIGEKNGHKLVKASKIEFAQTK